MLPAPLSPEAGMRWIRKATSDAAIFNRCWRGVRLHEPDGTITRQRMRRPVRDVSLMHRQRDKRNLPRDHSVHLFSRQGTAAVRSVPVFRTLLWVGSLRAAWLWGQEASSAAQARPADGADARPIRMGTTVRNGGSGVVVPVLAARAARSGWLSAAFWLRSTTTRPEA